MYLSIEYSVLDQEDYTETGAGNIGLEVENQAHETLLSGVGLKASSELGLGQVKLIPEFNIGWLRNLKTQGQESTTSMIFSSTANRSVGIDLPSHIYNIGAGLTLLKSDDSTISLKYDAQISDEFLSHSGYLQYRFLF